MWLRGVAIDLGDPEASAKACAAAVDALALAPEERGAMAAYAARAYDWRAMAEAVVEVASA